LLKNLGGEGFIQAGLLILGIVGAAIALIIMYTACSIGEDLKKNRPMIERYIKVEWNAKDGSCY